jgi:hypothetical protein
MKREAQPEEHVVEVVVAEEHVERDAVPVEEIEKREDCTQGAPKKSLLRRMEEANARYIFARQAGCMFRVVVDGVTVYSVDLNTLPEDEPFPFSTDNFTPQAGSTVAYTLECPPGTAAEDIPELDIAGLTLVTGPAAPPPVSEVSSAAGGLTSLPSVIVSTIIQTVTQVRSGTTIVSYQISVITATATQTAFATATATVNSCSHLCEILS